MKAAYETFVGRASATVCSIKSVATSTVKESRVYGQNVPHLPSSTSASSTEAKYRTPLLGDSVLGNQESRALNPLPSGGVEPGASILVERKEDLTAERMVIKRRPMPEFLRKAMEDSREVWKEKQARKHAIGESRERGGQLAYGGKDGAAVAQTV
jgi:hypothetical protein